jgi:CheY-like chemotaxis protein
MGDPWCRLLIEQISDAVWIQQDDRIVYANSAAGRLLGAASAAVVVGRCVRDVVRTSASPVAFAPEGNDAARVEKQNVVCERFDGLTVACEITCVPILFEGREAFVSVLHTSSARGPGADAETAWVGNAQPTGARRETADRCADTAADSGTKVSGFVLLAEDDKGVLAIAAALMKREGYDVLTAHDGAEAVALFEAHAEQIVALLFDVVMPTMGGFEAYAHIRARAPQLPAVFMSGNTQHKLPPGMRLVPGEIFIQKPFSRTTFLVVMRRVLGDRTRGCGSGE